MSKFETYLHSVAFKVWHGCLFMDARFSTYLFGISSVVRQKSESQNGCFKEANHAKISEKQTFLTP